MKAGRWVLQDASEENTNIYMYQFQVQCCSKTLPRLTYAVVESIQGLFGNFRHDVIHSPIAVVHVAGNPSEKESAAEGMPQNHWENAQRVSGLKL